jgi:uncharacterized RDD family membrane protein YckC
MKKITEIKITRYRTEAKKDKLGNRIKFQTPYQTNRPVEVIHGGQRFAHFFIDLLVFYAIEYMLGFLLGILNAVGIIGDIEVIIGYLSGGLALFLVFPLYYFLFEFFTQSSPGKMLLKRVVIDEFGNKPEFQTLLVRSLIRIVPFEGFSCLFSERGWHDKWSNTFVVSKDELEKIQTLLGDDESFVERELVNNQAM